jgi:hypothetical protein
MRSEGGGEGARQFGRVEEGPVRSYGTEKEVENDEMLGELLSELSEGFLEWDTAVEGVPVRPPV